jgi:hypothetical protein
MAIRKLSDVAKRFYNGYLQLHSADVTRQKFKTVFKHRFRDIHTDQYHFIELQTSWQGRNETPKNLQTGAGYCWKKIICKVGDPLTQRIHYENAERMLLGGFVAGLIRVPGRPVRYANPQTLQALKIALSVQHAEIQIKHEVLHQIRQFG